MKSEQKSVAVYEDTKERLDFYKFRRKLELGKPVSADQAINELLDLADVPHQTEKMLHAL